MPTLALLALAVPLTYRSQKYIKVDVPIVAIFFRICQAMALGMGLLQLYMNDGWALAETPGGMTNAWDESGTMLLTTDDPALPDRLPYCSNEMYSYAFRTYSLVAPACEALMPAELTTKTQRSLFFTTSIVETVSLGWPCAAADAVQRSAECAAVGGASFARSGGQCGCRSSRALYPLAVEEMEMAFEHAYATTEQFGWLGSSAKSDGSSPDDERLESVMVYSNGSEVTFAPGEPIAMRLSQWLQAANVSLDDINEAVPADPLGRSAPKRSTGVAVRVQVEYSNADRTTGRAVFGRRKMHAEVTVRPEIATWTGIGTTSNWVRYRPHRTCKGHATRCSDMPRRSMRHAAPHATPHTIMRRALCSSLAGTNLMLVVCALVSQIDYPTLPRGIPQQYHLVERWRHGVLFQFHLTGRVDRFDWFYLLGVAVSTMVLLKAANVAADFVAFYCLPNGQSTVLRNKREEIVSKRSEFAEIGMKAALAAATYRDFDPDNNGSIEAVDIVRMFAHVEGVSCDQAHAIAHAIMHDADTGDEGEVAGGPGGLSYVEYMTCLEGDAIDFAQFLKHVEPTKDASDLEECRLAFDEERAKLPAVAGRDASSPPEFTPLGLGASEKAARLTRKGTIKVHVKRAHGLKAADKNGLADPYVEMNIGKKVHKTKVKEKTLEPEWDEFLTFRNVTMGLAINKGLDVKLYDKDGFLSAGDAMGSLSASLQPLGDADAVSYKEGFPGQGIIEFAVEWTEGESSPPKKKALPSPAQLPPPDESTTAPSGDSPSPGKKKKKDKAPRAEADLDGGDKVSQTV